MSPFVHVCPFVHAHIPDRLSASDVLALAKVGYESITCWVRLERRCDCMIVRTPLKVAWY